MTRQLLSVKKHESNFVKLGKWLEHRRSVLWEGSLEKRPSVSPPEVFVAPGSRPGGPAQYSHCPGQTRLLQRRQAEREKAAGAGTESCHITLEIIVMNSVMKSETPVTGSRK